MKVPSVDAPLPKNGQRSLKVTQQLLAVAFFSENPWEKNSHLQYNTPEI